MASASFWSPFIKTRMLFGEPVVIRPLKVRKPHAPSFFSTAKPQALETPLFLIPGNFQDPASPFAMAGKFPCGVLVNGERHGTPQTSQDAHRLSTVRSWKVISRRLFFSPGASGTETDLAGALPDRAAPKWYPPYYSPDPSPKLPG